MTEGADEERDQGGHVAGDVGAGGTVHVAAEEMMHGDVPFPREFEPGGVFHVNFLHFFQKGERKSRGFYQSQEFHQSE